MRTGPANFVTDLLAATSYKWINVPGVVPEVTDQGGVAGQGVANPASLFGEHQVVKINGVYYDPSYGLTYANKAAIDAAMAGFWVVAEETLNEVVLGGDINGNGIATDVVIVWTVYFRTNPPGDQMAESPGNR